MNTLMAQLIFPSKPNFCNLLNFSKISQFLYKKIANFTRRKPHCPQDWVLSHGQLGPSTHFGIPPSNICKLCHQQRKLVYKYIIQYIMESCIKSFFELILFIKINFHFKMKRPIMNYSFPLEKQVHPIISPYQRKAILQDFKF